MLPREQISLNGHLYAFVDQGHGPTIVFLHGFCGSADYFKPILSSFTSTYRCIVPDLRGHGMSGTPEGSYTMQQIASDIHLLLQHLGIEQVTMFGHSLGGYTTLAFAEMYPQLLKGIGLIHSTAYPDTEEGKIGRAQAIEKIQTRGIEHFVDQLVLKLFAPSHKRTLSEQVTKVKKIGYHTSEQGAIATIAAMKERPDRNHIMKNLSCPILLIAGEDDQVIDKNKTFSLEGEHIQQVLIPRSGHMSMFENPTELQTALHTFLDTVY